MKGKIDIKIVLICVGAYAAYGIGSGFATGQEILQYFTSWGVTGCIISLICSAVLLSYSFSAVMRAGQVNQDIFKKDSDGYAYFGGKYFGLLVDIFSWIMVAAILVAMFAGCGATIQQYFGLPAYIGTISMCILTAVVVMLGLRRIQQVLGFLGIVFIVYIVIFGLYSIITSNVSLSDATANLQTYINEGKIYQAGILGIYNSVWAGLNYGGVCLITAFPFVLALGRRSKNPVEASVSGFNAGLWFHVPAAFSAFAIMLHLDYVATNGEQVPLLAAMTEAIPSISWSFAIILLLGIFTTIIGYMWFLTDRISEERTTKARIITAVIAVIAAAGGSVLPFNLILNKVFPITGVVGMILTVLIIIKDVRLAGEKKQSSV